jgi:hypothetical protein
MNEESTTAPQETVAQAPVAAPVAASATPPIPPPVAPMPGGDQSARKKAPAVAWVALGVAIFALVLALIPFATFGSGLFILAGLVLSIVALAKARGAKGAAVTALILSLVAVPVAITMSIVSFGLIAVADSTLNSALIEQQIASAISEELGIDSTVICPDSMTGPIGAAFECQATDMNGDSVIVDVTISDSIGDVTWEIRG